MAKKTTKKCPSCKSLIDVNEKTCPFCFHQFEENANAVSLSDKNEKVNQEITTLILIRKKVLYLKKKKILKK